MELEQSKQNNVVNEEETSEKRYIWSFPVRVNDQGFLQLFPKLIDFDRYNSSEIELHYKKCCRKRKFGKKIMVEGLNYKDRFLSTQNFFFWGNSDNVS